MEYSGDNGTTWKDVTSDTISGLNPGTYQVRVKAKDDVPAGKTAEIKVGSDYKALDSTMPVTIKKDGNPIGTTAPAVGDVLTAECGASDLTYEWFVGDSTEPAGTGSSYMVTADDMGKTIKARVTQTKKPDGSDYESGEAPVQESGPTAAVEVMDQLEA